MKFRMWIDKVEALKANNEEYGYQVVEIPATVFTDEQKEYLTQFQSQNRGIPCEPYADFYLDNASPYKASEATLETFVMALDAFIKERKEIAANKQAAHDKLINEALETPIEKLVTNGCMYYGNIELCEIKTSFGSIMSDPRLEEKKQLVMGYVKARNEQLKREREEYKRKQAEKRAIEEQRSAERKAALDAAMERLKTWALGNGSELLQERINSGFDWKSLAEQEFVDSIVQKMDVGLPVSLDELEHYTADSADERRMPTLTEIKHFKRLKESAKAFSTPDVSISVEIKYVRYRKKEDASYQLDEYYHRPELRIAFVLATRSLSDTIERWFHFDEAIVDSKQ